MTLSASSQTGWKPHFFRAVEADQIALSDAAGREDGAAMRARVRECLTDELFAEVALLRVLLEPEFADRAHAAAAGFDADRADDVAAVHHVEVSAFARGAVVDAALKAARVLQPRLPLERLQPVLQMARVVAVRHAERAVLVFEAAHRGILRVACAVDLVKRKSLQRADRQSDGHAV